MVLSIVDNINNWLNLSGLYNDFGRYTIMICIMVFTFISLRVMKMHVLISILFLIMEFMIFVVLGWVDMWILFVIGLILFLFIYVRVRSGGGVTVDD